MNNLIAALLFGLGLAAAGLNELRAGEVLDTDDPLLQEAVELWLDDNDAESLPLLAELAQEGNVAARLMLSRIEATDRSHSEFVRELSRHQRLELFRAPGESGKFRSSWLGRSGWGQ